MRNSWATASTPRAPSCSSQTSTVIPGRSATGAVELTLEGQGEIVGEHPFALVGGAGAVWLKTGEVENDGTLILRVKHQVLGTKTVSLRVIGTPKEITGVHGLTQEQKTARPPR
jgi:hypothetical protein